ncbi:MAG: glycosyltransferase family 39 protein, partial [Chloroflexota bacterium]|nr:glycosyltransferase family 39 protein [Chloroflexota bacterium]
LSRAGVLKFRDYGLSSKAMTSHRARPYILLFVLTIILRLATALPLQQAGYMDASYALHVAENLARGRGFTEDVLWNYLDNPAGLPHPSNLYWMPLPSILIAPFFALLGVSYRVAQIPFIVLSALLPLFAFYLSRKIFVRDDYAWAAAIFTAFSGFYTIYWVSPDNFTPFALTASVSLYVMARGIETGAARYLFAAGILIGLSHLARADGALLLAVAPLAVLMHRPTRTFRAVGLFTVYCLLGYLLVMSPWFARNYIAVGTPYPGAGTKTLWLTNYNELFHYADDLTPARYLASGIDSILSSKALAAGRNLLIITFGDLQVFLVPVVMIGLWQLRRRIEMLPFFIYAALLYAVMTIVFTFPSWRGSLLHSAAALLPFFAVAAPPGIDATVRWVARRRLTWDAAQASRFFIIGFCALGIFLALLLYSLGVFGPQGGDTPLWNLRDSQYVEIARWLDQNARAEDSVMVSDPPSFYNSSHRSAIMFPTDNVATIFAAARRYGVRYLILESDHPDSLADLYNQHIPVAGLAPVAEFSDALGRPVTLLAIDP